jgi:hypothetical protein
LGRVSPAVPFVSFGSLHPHEASRTGVYLANGSSRGAQAPVPAQRQRCDGITAETRGGRVSRFERSNASPETGATVEHRERRGAEVYATCGYMRPVRKKFHRSAMRCGRAPFGMPIKSRARRYSAGVVRREAATSDAVACRQPQPACPTPDGYERYTAPLCAMSRILKTFGTLI